MIGVSLLPNADWSFRNTPVTVCRPSNPCYSAVQRQGKPLMQANVVYVPEESKPSRLTRLVPFCDMSARVLHCVQVTVPSEPPCWHGRGQQWGDKCQTWLATADLGVSAVLSVI